MKPFVLITDVHLRKAFDVVNILENRYADRYTCLLASDRDCRVTLPLVYGQRIFRLRKDSYAHFESDFFRILYEHAPLVYVPIEEDTTLLFYEFVRKNQGIEQLHYLLPEEKAFNIARDKGKTQAFCAENGFPIPKNYDFSDLESLQTDFRPLIAKPTEGSGSAGIVHVNVPEDLRKLQYLKNTEGYILQEKIGRSNAVQGAFFLFQNGQLVSYYGHRRLRTYPISGGVTVYSVSANTAILRGLGGSILEKLNWSGVAMLEFLEDESGPKLIEINPRLWGSVMLSEFCGADFLNSYIALSLGQNSESKQAANDRYIRWFFPFDVLNFFKNRGKIDRFWHFDRTRTCYINFTYATWRRALSYLLYTTFNRSKIAKFFRKITS